MKLITGAAALLLLTGCGGEAARDRGGEEMTPREMQQAADEAFLEKLEEHDFQTYANDEELLDLADITCDSLADGIHPIELAFLMAKETHISEDDAGFFVGLAGGMYCPNDMEFD